MLLPRRPGFQSIQTISTGKYHISHPDSGGSPTNSQMKQKTNDGSNKISPFVNDRVKDQATTYVKEFYNDQRDRQLLLEYIPKGNTFAAFDHKKDVPGEIEDENVFSLRRKIIELREKLKSSNLKTFSSENRIEEAPAQFFKGAATSRNFIVDEMVKHCFGFK